MSPIHVTLKAGVRYMHYIANYDDICLLDDIISPVVTEIFFIQFADLKNGILVFENVLPCLRNGGVVKRS